MNLEPTIPDGYQPMTTAPRNGTEIIGIYEDGAEDHIQWEDSRRCAGEGPNSYFGPGWNSTEVNLMVDAPIAWKPL